MQRLRPFGRNQNSLTVGIFDAAPKSPAPSLAICVLLWTVALAGPGSAFAATHDAVSTTAQYSVALIDIAPNQSNNGASLLRRHIRVLRSMTGCLRVDLVRQAPPSANHFALLTVWRDAASHDRYIGSAASHAFRTQLQPLAASPIDDRLYGTMAP